MKKIGMMLLTVLLLVACQKQKEQKTLSGLLKSDFVANVEGKEVALYQLVNEKGAEVCITNWGGRIVSVMVPDREGQMKDVVLGFDCLADYINADINFGSFVGRYGNRIGNAQFTLNGQTYQLPANNGTHCLHGGKQGFDRHVCDVKQVDKNTLVLSYLSKDGEEGFPGNLNVTLTYKLTEDNAIDIKYEAETDKPTIVNLTNHSYFNLSGVPGADNAQDQIMINADSIVPVDESLVPVSGDLMSVEGTPLDLRNPIVIGDHIDEDFDQLEYGGGYDQNFVLNTKGDESMVAATLYSPHSGIALEVYTNEPGLQLYTGNAMKGNDKGKFGAIYPHRGAVCLETQHYPDSPNRVEFPSTVLSPGEKYYSRCIYKFTVE